jgi:UDP-2,3-diacylglucosamine hydrolase
VTTLFISDLHLDDKRPGATELFLSFLGGEAGSAEALYILGDLFEYWLGDDAPTPVGQAVCQGLASLSANGVACHFMHGNRDFLLGQAFARQAGFSLLAEETVIELYGRPTLLLHGDSLCTDDVGYQQVRKIMRDPAWQEDFLLKSPQDRVRFAQEAREMSAEYKQGVSMEIMDVNATAVVDAFTRHGVGHMIHGHTHRPAVHEHSLPTGTGERIVLGDWYEQGSVLRVTPAGATLESMPL